MFFTFTVEFGRRKHDEPDDGPYMVVESAGQHERAPIGFSVEDPWYEEEEGRRGNYRSVRPR